MSASSEQNAAALTPTSPTAAVPAPPPQQPCRFETLYLGYIRVEKEKGKIRRYWICKFNFVMFAFLHVGMRRTFGL